METKNYFNELSKIDVSKHVTTKTIQGNELSYLSWAHAWKEVKKADAMASFKVLKFENNLPYVFDPSTGYMVFTEVTIFGNTLDCFLPVMNNNNRAMRDKSYTYKTKYGEKTVEIATMMDINKTIMRCLVKNMAFHGLGLNIYAGEDLPDENGNDVNHVNSPNNKESSTKSSPAPASPLFDGEIACSLCGKSLKLRKGPKGEFYGCSGYPVCKNTATIEQIKELKKVQEEIKKNDDVPF